MQEATTSRVVAITGERAVELRDVPRPRPLGDQVLVKVAACALCTWEQRTYTGVDRSTPMPFVGGHEYTGVVAEIGPGANTSLEVGDKVAVGPRPQAGHEGPFAVITVEDLWGPFGLSEHRAVPTGRAYKLADDLDLAAGCFAEPLGCVIRSMDRLQPDLGEDVVVIGGGTMGLLNMMVARLYGTRVIVSDLDPARRERAVELGAHAAVDPAAGAGEQVRELTGGRGAGIVIVAIGNHHANVDALDMVGPEGRVMLFASAHPATDLTIDPNWIHRGEVTLTGSRHPDVRSFARAVALLSKRLIDVDPLIEARVGMDDAKRAFELAVRPDTYRVIVTMHD